MPERRENFSRKREAILAALRGTDVHPTAEWIYQQLKPDYPDLSLGTVYRNLGRFRESGLAASLGAIKGHERFDGDTSPHAHLVCRRCGAVVDVYGALPGKEQLDAVSEMSGCRAESACVTFSGLCKSCISSSDCIGSSDCAGEGDLDGTEESDL